MLGFEIGNEGDYYGSHGLKPAWSLAAFEAMWQSFRDAIVYRVPNAVLTGPALGTHVDDWTVPFARGPQGAEIRLLTQHFYVAGAHTPAATAARLLAPDRRLAALCGSLRRVAAERGIPFRIAEANSFYNGGEPGVSDSLASALWVVGFMLAAAQGGCSGVNFHGGRTGPYTAIASRGAEVTGVRPLYYGLLLVAAAGTGSLLRTSLEGDAGGASCFAVGSGAGQRRLVLVNPDEARTLPLEIVPAERVRAATVLALCGPGLAAQDEVTLGGRRIVADGTATSPGARPLSVLDGVVRYDLPPVSAALVRLE